MQVGITEKQEEARRAETDVCRIAPAPERDEQQGDRARRSEVGPGDDAFVGPDPEEQRVEERDAGRLLVPGVAVHHVPFGDPPRSVEVEPLVTSGRLRQ
jgi:hypothetical protein